mgnify:CR=1 FL=1
MEQQKEKLVEQHKEEPKEKLQYTKKMIFSHSHGNIRYLVKSNRDYVDYPLLQKPITFEIKLDLWGIKMEQFKALLEKNAIKTQIGSLAPEKLKNKK